MRELNPVGREDNTLLLVSEDGERFTVTVDDTLLRTLKEHRLPDGSGEELSPRQIQDAIRSGESISAIAERSGTGLSLIERFAHPVLEELQHMVDLAKSIRVELPADRFNEVEKKPFGEVVSEKLIAGGATEISWAAKRGENSVWEVSVNFNAGGSEGSATWSFDPRRYLLTPETSTAQNLSNPSSTFDSPLGNITKPSPMTEHPSAGEPVVTAEKLQAFRSRRAKTEEVTPEPKVEIVAEQTPETTIEVVADVIPITGAIEQLMVDIGEESQEELTEIVMEPAEPETKKTIQDPPKRNRAPMPSWDQIVRGTQSDDGEAF